MNKISSRENFSTGKRGGREKMLANFVNLSFIPHVVAWSVASFVFFPPFPFFFSFFFFLFFFFERIIVTMELNGDAGYIVIQGSTVLQLRGDGRFKRGMGDCARNRVLFTCHPFPVKFNTGGSLEWFETSRVSSNSNLLPSLNN